jgi:glucose-1-phosphate cytidylyltransferase
VKVVILAGGLGTRLSEETELKPKPMVEIGDRPILWHIMKHYAHYGFKEFVVAVGYKGSVIKQFFLDYNAMKGHTSIDLSCGKAQITNDGLEDWLVHLVDTGLPTQTGGRLMLLQPWLGNESFMLTYGDGVCDVNIGKLLAFHQSHGRLATITGVRPPARFGSLEMEGDCVVRFTEKGHTSEGWINGGYLIFEPRIFDYLKSETASLEADVLERLAAEKQLMVYRHDGFWQCMDTLRDLRFLRSAWDEGNPPWRVWQ